MEIQANNSAAADLQTIESVLTGVEQSKMQAGLSDYPSLENSQRFDQSQVGFAQTLNQQNDVDRIETDDLDELNSWRQSLIERDQELSAFDLRIFCSNIQPPLATEVYCSLAGFYRNLSPTVSVLSKFDYVITHYFSREISKNRRVLRMNADELLTTLRQLNDRWRGQKINAALMKSQIRQAIFALSKLSAQAKTSTTLKDWLDSGVFNHSREIKRGLSETFFVPEVTATVILYNLTVGNQFAALCDSGSAALSESSASLVHDEAVQDAVADQLNSSFQTLLYSQLEEDFAEKMAHERLINLFDLISDAKINKEDSGGQPSFQRHVSPQRIDYKIAETNSPSEIVTNLDAKKVTEKLALGAVQLESVEIAKLTKTGEDSSVSQQIENQEFNKLKNHAAEQINEDNSQTFVEMGNVLRELSKVDPDREIIRNYLQKSATPAIRDLRFGEFLDVERATDDKNLRRALRLIISAEETIRLIAADEGNLSPAFPDELHLLNEEIQLINNRLRRSMNERVTAGEDVDHLQNEHFETLLYATNTLIETQLRLNSTMIRRQNAEEPKQFVDSQKIVFDDLSVKPPKVEASQSQSSFDTFLNFKENKWFLLGAALVILLGASWLITNWTFNQNPMASSNAQNIDPSTLNGGTNLIAAKVSKNTLFGFVGEKWTSQMPEAKKNDLKTLLNEGGKRGFNRVLIISQSGELVGNASEAGITVH